MDLNDFLNKRGGLQKIVVVSKRPSTIEEMFESSYNKQKLNGVNGKGSWLRKGKFTPKCGIHSLFNDSGKTFLKIESNEWDDTMTDLWNVYKSGNLSKQLSDCQKRREESILKRKENSKKE